MHVVVSSNVMHTFTTPALKGKYKKCDVLIIKLIYAAHFVRLMNNLTVARTLTLILVNVLTGFKLMK